MSVNRDRLKKRKEEIQKGGGVLRAKEGKNFWRVFLFEHTVEKGDFEKQIYNKGEVKVGSEQTELDRPVKMHFWDGGRGVCSGEEGCPACSDAAVLSASSTKADKRAGKMLSAREMYHLNVVNMEDQDAGVQVASIPRSAYEPILNMLLDEDEYGEACFGRKGRDVIIKKDKTATPAKQYEVSIRDKSRSEALPSSVDKEAVDLMAESDYDPGEGMDNYEEEFEDEQKKGKPKAGTKVKEKEDPPLEDEKPLPDDEAVVAVDEDHDLVGKDIEFEDDGEEYKGTVVSVSGDFALVQVDKDQWDVELDEITVSKKEKKKARKR